MASRLTYKVVFASSSDNNHTEKELEIRNDNTSDKKESNNSSSSSGGTAGGGGGGASNGRGWQSERFCDYPQYLILHLIDICEIKQIQILSHQSKIASKIEIWVASDSRLTWKHALKAASQRDEAHKYHSNVNTSNSSQYWKKVTWKRLGYLSLDKNERSNWKARELKSVYIDTKANLIKFALHESHINTINLFNQTGIVGLTVLGTSLGVTTMNNNNNNNNHNNNDMIDNTFGSDTTPNQLTKTKHKRYTNNNDENDNMYDDNNNNEETEGGFDENGNKYDPATARKLRELNRLKQIAVEREDYDEAKRCKMAIEHLENVASELVSLEKNKQMAVEREDYDEAKTLKLQIIRLRELSLNPNANANNNNNNNNNSMPNNIHHNNNLTPSHQQLSARFQQQHQHQSPHGMGMGNPAGQMGMGMNSMGSMNMGMAPMGAAGMMSTTAAAVSNAPPFDGINYSRQYSNQSMHSHRSQHSQHSHHSHHHSQDMMQESHTPHGGSGGGGGGYQDGDGNGMMMMTGMGQEQGRFRAADERAIRPMGNNFEFGTADMKNVNPFGSRNHVNPYEEQPILPPKGDPFEKFKNATEDDIPPIAPKRVNRLNMLNNKNNNVNTTNNMNNIDNNDSNDDENENANDNNNNKSTQNKPAVMANNNNNNNNNGANMNGFGSNQKRGMSSNGNNNKNGGENDPPPLKAAIRKDNENLIDLLGENIIACLYSPNWSHRNDGLTKIIDIINGNTSSQHFNNHTDKREIFKLLCKIINKSLNDKVAHVFLTGIDLFNALLETFSNQVKMEDVFKYCHSSILALVNTLGHSNTRMVDAAGSMLITLAHHDSNLCKSVFHDLLKPMRRNLPKHLKGRGVVLLELIPQFQIPKGMNISQFMQIIKIQLEDKNGDVRDVGIQLTTMLYQISGNSILPFLDDLNDFIKETLNHAFLEATGQANVLERAPKSQTEQQRPSKAMARTSNSSAKKRKISNGSNNRNSNGNHNDNNNGKTKINNNNNKRTLNNANNHKRAAAGAQAGAGGGHGAAPNNKRNNGKMGGNNKSPVGKRSPARGFGGGSGGGGGGGGATASGANQNGNNEQEFEDMCNFCGLRDPSFALNEENLDLHYWQACPMLTSCKLCEQVIEIPTLHEHILSECEAAEKHERCRKCQIPIAVSQLKEHMQQRNCKGALPSNEASRCTLCHEDIEPNEQGWRKHLLTYPGCPQNERPLPLPQQTQQQQQQR